MHNWPHIQFHGLKHARLPLLGDNGILISAHIPPYLSPAHRSVSCQTLSSPILLFSPRKHTKTAHFSFQLVYIETRP